jgi:hypothetical protein
MRYDLSKAKATALAACAVLTVAAVVYGSLVPARAAESYGDAAAVGQIRLLGAQRGDTMQRIAVAGPYGLGQWTFGNDTAFALYGKLPQGWTLLATGVVPELSVVTLRNLGISPSTASCLAETPHGTEAAHCAGISSSPSPTDAATMLVLSYYRLWQDEYQGVTGSPARQMYAELSSAYRSDHAFASWQRSYDLSGTDPEIALTNVRAVTPSTVTFTLQTKTISASNAHSAGITTTTYDGRWTLVRERGQLRLDTLTLHKTGAHRDPIAM